MPRPQTEQTRILIEALKVPHATVREIAEKHDVAPSVVYNLAARLRKKESATTTTTTEGRKTTTPKVRIVGAAASSETTNGENKPAITTRQKKITRHEIASQLLDFRSEITSMQHGLEFVTAVLDKRIGQIERARA